MDGNSAKERSKFFWGFFLIFYFNILLFYLFIFIILLLGQSIHPFCNKVKRDPLETECTDDRSSVALCNLVQHDNLLPATFQVRGC